MRRPPRPKAPDVARVGGVVFVFARGSLLVVVVSLVAPTAHADPPAVQRAGRAEPPGDAAARNLRGERAAGELAPEAAAAASTTPDGARPDRGRLRPMSVTDQVVSAGLSASVLAVAAIPFPTEERASWRGSILFDEAARGGLLLSSVADRRTAASISDGLVIGLAALPVVLDAALIVWAARGDVELAMRLMVIDLQAHAIAQGLTTIIKHAVRRERPMARACREDSQRRADDPSCEGVAEPGIAPESFFSGHTSLAFTSAALICLHHTELGLFGEGGDAAMCATGLAMASTVGLLRILSDRHYASDVIMGAAAGLLSGWLVPWLLHFEIGGGPGQAGTSLAPMIDANQVGMQVFGVF